MLSYRHGFHAGNYADVLKHITEILLLKSMLRKDKPFCYIDTHAGAGAYSLKSDWSNKTGEYLNGIAKVFHNEKLHSAAYFAAFTFEAGVPPWQILAQKRLLCKTLESSPGLKKNVGK